MLGAGIEVPFKYGGLSLADTIVKLIEENGSRSPTFRLGIDFSFVRQFFEPQEFDKWWAGLKSSGIAFESGPMIASGNFTSEKAGAEDSGQAQGPATEANQKLPKWAAEQQKQLARLIENARKQSPRPPDLPDRLVPWFNERTQTWYLNVWVYFDPTGSKKTASALPLHSNETPEQLLERVRTATAGELQKSEDSDRQKLEKQAPYWARKLAWELKVRLDKLHQGEKNATDFPDGMALTAGPGVSLQIWVERGSKQFERNYGTVPLMPESNVEDLVPYVRHLAALLRQFERSLEENPVPVNADKTGLSAFPARIVAKDLPPDQVTVTGANNEFNMQLNYEAVFGIGPLQDLYVASKLYQRPITFYWEIYHVSDVLKKQAPDVWFREDPAGGKDRWHWLYQQYNPRPDKGGITTVPEPGALALFTTDIKTLDLVVTQTNISTLDSTTRLKLPSEPGDYLIRCVTVQVPTGEQELKRAPSEAWYPIETKPAQAVVEAAASERTARIADLEAELKGIDSLLAGGKLPENERQALRAKAQIESGDLARLQANEGRSLSRNTADEIAYASGMLARVEMLNSLIPDLKFLAKAKGVAPSELLSDKPELLTLYWYLIAVGKTPGGYKGELEADLVELKKTQDQAKDFQADFNPSSRDQSNPEAAFVSEVTGQVYRLVLMLGEAPEFPASLRDMPNMPKVVYSLVDITSPQTKNSYKGVSLKTGPEGRKEAIDNAFEKFGDDATYGEGLIAVRIPGIGMQTYKSKQGILQKVLWALGIIAAVAGAAALIATGVGAPAAAGILGAVAAAAGAITSIHNLSERSSRHTLKWDAETGLDIIGILGVVPAVAGANRVLNAARGIETVAVGERFFQIYRWTETGATAILVPTKLAQDIQTIHHMRETGEITEEQEAAMIEEAKLGRCRPG